MKLASPYAVAAGVFLAGVFVARAAIGVPAAKAYARGRAVENAGAYAEAGRLLDRGAVGGNLSAGLWRAGWSRVEAWRDHPSAVRYGPVGQLLLREAAVRVLKARAASPGSAWLTAALGNIYKLREREARSRRVVDLRALEHGPWALVGDDGRIAIGLTRAAIESEPNRFDYRDQLVFILEDNSLHEDALIAMEDAARVLPDFGEHQDFFFELLPRDLVETFWRTARAVAPGEAPILSRERQLLAAGQLGRRLGHLAEAEQDLRAAMETPGTELNRAEDAFHLALVLADLERYDEAEAMLARALRQPVFGPGVAQTRAWIAEKRGRWPEALAALREARRLQPRDLGVLLAFARAAEKTGDLGQADEAIRWSVLIYPNDPLPRQALVELLLAQGDTKRARGALDDYIRLFGANEGAKRLEQSLTAKVDPGPR